jgi:hypothetical protein
MNRQAEDLLRSIIHYMETFDPTAACHWKRYQEVFYETYPSWTAKGDVFYAQAAVIAIIKQLAYHDATGVRRHRILFDNYVKDFPSPFRKLDKNRMEILKGIIEGLQRLADMPDGHTPKRKNR